MKFRRKKGTTDTFQNDHLEIGKKFQPLRKTARFDRISPFVCPIVEEVAGLHVAMDDVEGMDAFERRQQTSHVLPHFFHGQRRQVNLKS